MVRNETALQCPDLSPRWSRRWGSSSRFLASSSSALPGLTCFSKRVRKLLATAAAANPVGEEISESSEGVGKECWKRGKGWRLDSIWHCTLDFDLDDVGLEASSRATMATGSVGYMVPNKNWVCITKYIFELK